MTLIEQEFPVSISFAEAKATSGSILTSSMAFYQDAPWHSGETEMMKAMRAPLIDNPTYPALSPQLANHLQIAPLVAIGTLDKHGRPWTTLWGGHKGLSQPLAEGIIGIKTPVTGKHDPVVEELVGKEATGQVVKEEGKGRMVSGLTIDLETRKRVKMYGRMIAGALMMREDEATEQKQAIAEVQLVLKIEQSLGNCPKYLNKKAITTAVSSPELRSDSPVLGEHALALLAKADLFFISSSQNEVDMDTNHRGGPAGFVRVLSNEAPGAVLVYPEYSGNRLYQTLGNLKVNPLAGICVPDFETGDMLYLSGTTEILIGTEASKLLPRSNLAVKLAITAARFVSKALPFRGTSGESSPYNPTLRYLATEKSHTTPQDQEMAQATLLLQTSLTPSISRFKFSLANSTRHKAGQYVTLDFSGKMDMGYSHMRDDDPRSLNDDFVRTFTVSSPPADPPMPMKRLRDDEFEITIRRVGTVTEEMFKHAGTEGGDRMALEVGVKGFGGEFEVETKDGSQERIAFVAAGVGITPLLPSLHTLDLERLDVIWTIRAEDLGLVNDALMECPELAYRLRLFVTNVTQPQSKGLEDLKHKGVRVEQRRMQDIDVQLGGIQRYYLCTATPLRKQLMEWLPEEELVFEDFNF